MSRLMFGLGAVLILWGLYVLATGDFVATVDIAAGLVGWGVGAIGLGAVIRSLDAIAAKLAARAPARAGVDVGAFEIHEDDVAPALPASRPPALKPAARKLPPMPEEPAVPVAAPTPPSRPSASPAPAVAEPELVREGVIEGRRYRFYSDGSIEAEGADGLRRYKSIDEAREEILRERGEREEAPRSSERSAPPASQAVSSSRAASEPSAASSAPPPSFRRAAAPPPAPSSAQPSQPAANKPVVRPQPAEMASRPPQARQTSAPSAPIPSSAAAAPGIAKDVTPSDPVAKPSDEPAVTWESYLAAGASPQPPGRSGANPPQPPPMDDEEWAEPFRMLLRGGGAEGAQNDAEPKKR